MVTPISDEDAEEMAQRFITSEEDLEELSSKEGWADFVSSKLITGGTDKQLAVFERGRMTGFQEWEQTGLGVRYPWLDQPQRQQLWDLTTGRIMSKAEADLRIATWYQLRITLPSLF